MTEQSCPILIDDLNHLINYCICHTDLDRASKNTLRVKWKFFRKELEKLLSPPMTEKGV